MDFLSLLILFGICVGVFLGLLLISLARGNQTANRLLGLLLLSFSFSITGFLLNRTGTASDYPYLIGLSQFVLFLFGPLFYFYVKVLTRRKFSFREQHFLHFLPFLFLIIYKIPFIIKSAPEKMALVNEHSFRMENIAILVLQIIHLFLYIFFTNKLIDRHERRVKSTMSSIDKINLRWLRMGIYFFVSVFGVMFGFTLLFFAGTDLFHLFNIIIPLSVSFIISVMGYYGLKQPIIFPGEEENLKPKKYRKSKLNDEISEEYLQKLLDHMEKEKPYLQNNLTLHRLATALGITPHQLSQILNDKLNQNFFDFINQYRIKEAQRILSHPQGQLLTILAVSEEVGFNSKTAFNTAFRKTTKMTPSEYRKLKS
jgi:AraC-like DNA-binding protein